jgi:hypothetical protein
MRTTARLLMSLVLTVFFTANMFAQSAGTATSKETQKQGTSTVTPAAAADKGTTASCPNHEAKAKECKNHGAGTGCCAQGTPGKACCKAESKCPSAGKGCSGAKGKDCKPKEGCANKPSEPKK